MFTSHVYSCFSKAKTWGANKYLLSDWVKYVFCLSSSSKEILHSFLASLVELSQPCDGRESSCLMCWLQKLSKRVATKSHCKLWRAAWVKKNLLLLWFRLLPHLIPSSLSLPSWLMAPLWKQPKLLSSRTVLDQHSWLFWKFADLHTCPRSYPPLAGAVTAPTAYKYHFCHSVLYTAFSSTGLACYALWEKSETFLLLCYVPSTASPLWRIEAGEMARRREKEARKNRQKHPSSYFIKKFQFSSVQLLSRVRLCDPMNHSTPDLPVHYQLPSLLKRKFIQSVMPSSHLILCRPLLLLSPIPPSIRVFSNESTLRISWPKYWSFSFNISPSNEHPGLISFRMDWLDLLAV